MEEVETIAKQPTSIPISCTQELNLDTLLEMLWEQMGLVRASLVFRVVLCLEGSCAVSPGALLPLFIPWQMSKGYDTARRGMTLHLHADSNLLTLRGGQLPPTAARISCTA